MDIFKLILGVQADRFEHSDHGITLIQWGRGLRQKMIGLSNKPADFMTRVERAVGILKHHLNITAQIGARPMQALPIEPDIALINRIKP